MTLKTQEESFFHDVQARLKKILTHTKKITDVKHLLLDSTSKKFPDSLTWGEPTDSVTLFRVFITLRLVTLGHANV